MTQQRIDPTTADYDGSLIRHLGNAVYLRLMTPLGAYWHNPKFGSRLHELQREKNLARVQVLAVQYAQQALQPLLDDGRATAIDVQATRESNVPTARMLLQVNVTDASGDVHVFMHPVQIV